MLPTKELSYAVVIPARFQSSRFPGKPLVDINGKPMIQHVWEKCISAVDKKLVYIATDNQKIATVCQNFGANVVMTSDTCKTGTDRVAEANLQLNFDFLINVQGDEPLVNPADINKVISEYLNHPGQVINAMCPIASEDEFRSLNVPKIVVTSSSRLMYMSRSPIPITKTNDFKKSFKQVCIYAFSKEHLVFFSGFEQKMPIEEIEDIEILRFLENDIPVRMVEVEAGSVAVDIPADVGRVLSAMGIN